MRLLPLFLALAVVGCASEPRTARLEAGREVQLILLQQLSAGGSNEGSEVAFMVSEDIAGEDGSILIPRGAIAYGRVNWSRSAGALSKLTNEPPRLAVSIDRTTTIDNRVVMLQATESGEPFHFTGKNTARENASDRLSEALEDDVTRDQIERLFGAFEGKTMGDERVVRELAERLGLESTAKMAGQHSLSDVQSVLKHVVEGEAKRIVGGQTTLIIDTIAELAGLRFNVGDRIAGIFRGPTIHAFPGAPVTAYVAEPIEIRVD